jgi:hypothetical protein
LQLELEDQDQIDCFNEFVPSGKMPPKRQSNAQQAAERSKRRRDEEELSQFSEVKKMLECPGVKSMNVSPRSRK